MDKVFKALADSGRRLLLDRLQLDPEFTRRYWCETVQESEWKPGASWRVMIPDGLVADSSQIVEIEPHCKLVHTWRNEFKPEFHDDFRKGKLRQRGGRAFVHSEILGGKLGVALPNKLLMSTLRMKPRCRAKCGS